MSRVLRSDATALPYADGSIDLIVTSPPYWSLRAYQDDGYLDGQIGDEDSMEQYLVRLYAVMAECWRVLAPWGIACVVIGDSRSGSGGAGGDYGHNGIRAGQPGWIGTGRRGTSGKDGLPRRRSLCGVPWRFALGCLDGLADPEGIGWVLANEVIWDKDDCGMPESVADRLRGNHEQVFVFAKSSEWFGDAYASARDYRGTPRRRLSERVDHVQRQVDAPQHWGRLAPIAKVDNANGLGRIPGDVSRVQPKSLSQPDYLVIEHDGSVRGVSDPVGLKPPWKGGADPSPAMRSIAEDVMMRRIDGRLQPTVLHTRHYAAFPPGLVEPLIRIFSPESVCLTCGEPRRRVLGRQCESCGAFVQRATRTCESCGATRSWKDGRQSLPEMSSDWHQPGRSAPRKPGNFTSTTIDPTEPDRHPETRGWHSGQSTLLGAPLRTTAVTFACRCATPDSPTRPGRVLDPMCGSGTVPTVADALGRIGLGSDLSQSYCYLATWRQQTGIDGKPGVAGVVDENQLSLFAAS